jgi:signal transduction histidine kinase
MIGPLPPPEAVPFSEVGGAQSDTADRYLEPLQLETKDHQSDPEAIPIDNLRLLSPIVPTQVTVHGVVTLTSPVLFIQDSSGGLEVLPENAKMPLEIGDEVEAHGDLFPGNFSSVLKHASVHVLWSRVPVPPVSVTASQATSGNFDARFIETEGELEQKQQGPDQSIILTMSDGSQSFRAIVRGKGQSTFPWTIKEKSRLLLHGICVVDAAWTQSETPFAVILPSIDDIQVIQGPPWWSAGHIAAAVIVCFVLVVAIQALYGRIESMRLHAILEERERLALEMHDTLAQSFAGIGFQLQAIRDEIGNEAELSEHLDLADALVRTSHEEARRSISALRSETLEEFGLFKALDKCAGMLVNGGSIRIRCSTKGDARTIPPRVSDCLFRIGQEAIANAVRHAQPTEIGISLVYAPGMLWLIIRDNGRGLPAGEDSASFGIRGMGRRAERIGATLDIRSAAGQGTTVEVRAPLPAKLIPEIWQNLWTNPWKRRPLNLR